MSCPTRLRAWMASVFAAVIVAGAGVAPATAGVIFVTTLQQKIGPHVPGCSLQEAIFAANFDAALATVYSVAGQTGTVATTCVAGSGDDVIVLPQGATLQFDAAIDDATNPFGPTATPLVSSGITIDGHGATIQHGGTTAVRAFAVGTGGRLMLRQVTVRGFVARGGDGGVGGGGGMGAGGAVYVGGGHLVVEGSTFVGNTAIGGNGAGSVDAELTFGGGGGIGGHGRPDGDFVVCEGGIGGGGARGNGAGVCEGLGNAFFGGGGGGTLRAGSSRFGGIECGGNGGVGSTGGNASCAGGGGGGGGTTVFLTNDGGNGGYGGGGGAGGRHGGNGGHGGFGGGGGAGWGDNIFGADGGDGGFGGGGGSSGYGLVNDGGSGSGGMFGGDGRRGPGGGGAGLGGAIFNHAGVVTVRNSTFTNNIAVRGVGGGAGTAPNGSDRGAAIFAVDGEVNVAHSTLAGNQGTGFGAGLVVVQWQGAAGLRLYNSIVADNGAGECSLAGTVAVDMRGNLIEENDNCLGVAATSDPLLGPLQSNQGRTATMALPLGSPAVNAADPNVALAVDQRGQDRPSQGGFDIGAYELCLTGPPQAPFECLITGGVVNSDPVDLTMAVSPSGGGLTTPAVGVTTVERYTVVLIAATAGPGYRFAGWSGAVTDPTAAATTVVMDQAKAVTANFVLIPDFSLGVVNGGTMALGESEFRLVPVIANATFSQPVTFSTANAPAGIAIAYTPASVTPPFGGTINGRVDISVSPSAVAGTYSFDIVGTAGTLVRSTPVVLNVVATAASLITTVDTYQTLGCIDNHGIANSFQSKLSQAQTAIGNKDYRKAGNSLSALLNHIQAQTGKHLKTSCSNGSGGTFNAAQTLTTNVTSLMGTLGQ